LIPKFVNVEPRYDTNFGIGALVSTFAKFAPASAIDIAADGRAIYSFPHSHDNLCGLVQQGSVQMARKGLDGRHRDTTGRIDKKHGNTRVGSLRKTYGEHFAKGRRKDMMLKTLLAETGTESLHAYLRKHHK
jgi:hypothetical protein